MHISVQKNVKLWPSDKVDSSEVYTKGEIDTSMDLKANSADVEADMLLKSDKASTFTKTEVNTYLSNKANTADVYDKSSIDTQMGTKSDTATTYTKSQVDS